MLYLKEENFIVMEVGTHSIHAGVADLFVPPPVVHVYTKEEQSIISSSGVVQDWLQLEKLCKKILFLDLKITKSRNECPVLLSVPTIWTKLDYERATKIFFEGCNSLGLYIMPKPLASLFGVSCISGVVIDIGQNEINITPILDSTVQRQSIQVLNFGMKDVQEILLQEVHADAELMRSFQNKSDDDILHAFYEAQVLQAMLPGIHPNDKKEFKLGDLTFKVGSERYTCVDALFPSSDTTTLTLSQAFLLLLHSIEPEKRLTLMDNILVTGSGSLIKDINDRIEFELKKIYAVTDNIGEFQPRDAKFLKISEVYEHIKEKPNLASWIGASAAARIIFPDPKSYVTKSDYNTSGPIIIHTKQY